MVGNEVTHAANVDLGFPGNNKEFLLRTILIQSVLRNVVEMG